MTGSFTRRGFLGLSAMAAAGPALAACTGGGTARLQPAEARPRPASNNLRVFTYEDDATIDLLKDQMQIRRASTARRRPSTACLARARRCIRTSSGPSCSAAAVLTSGGSGAARSARPSSRPSRPSDLAPYYQKFGWDSRINTTAIEG